MQRAAARMMAHLHSWFLPCNPILIILGSFYIHDSSFNLDSASATSQHTQTQNIGAAGILASGHSFTSGTVRSTTQLTGLLGALPHDASAPSTAPAVTVCIEEAGGSKGPADEGFHQIPQAPSTGGTIDSTGELFMQQTEMTTIIFYVLDNVHIPELW